ncbi:MAG: YkgJ family cysteine cluster protein [Candidatus Woesearchaeota archaeon]
MRFKCVHCGHCCINKSVQASITLDDIKRISEFTGKDHNFLINNNFLGLVASGTSEPNVFDIDIGLKYPCKFRKDNKCSIYEARPLNCRIFPLFLIAEVPFRRLKEYLDEDFKCRDHIEDDKENLRQIREYKKNIGTQILKESEKTDKFMAINNLAKKIDISQHQNFPYLKVSSLNPKSQACKRIIFCESLIDKSHTERLKRILDMNS